MQGWAGAFPDSRTEITGLYAGDDFVDLEFTGRGTHEGVLKTPMGEVPPTSRLVEVHFCEVYRTRDGKIASGHTYFDAATGMVQLGLMPAPRQTGT